MSIISLEDVCVCFDDDKKILNNLNFKLNLGEHIAILGPSACGKSTLLKLIVGLIFAQEGKVEVFSKKIFELKDFEKNMLRKKIGFAFQRGALFDFMTIRENILFSMQSFSLQEQEYRVCKFLDQVNLVDVKDKLPGELSGGMRRRVSIIRALITDPELVILDEPTYGLDTVNTSVILDLLKQIGTNTKTSMICATSNVEVAFRFAPKVAILYSGNIIGFGTYAELMNLGDTRISNFLNLGMQNLMHKRNYE